MSVQSIIIRRLNKIHLPDYRNSTFIAANKPLVATFSLNLQALGYTLSPIALTNLLALTTATASKVMDDALAALKEIKGERNYKPMYPNFPQQVIDASDAELYINAMMHYFSFQLVDLTGDSSKIWLPTYVKDKREPLTEKVELQVLEVALYDDIHALVARIATSNTSISSSDKEDLRTLWLAGYGDIPTIFPAIRNKENLAYFGSLIVGTTLDIAPYFRTATDVLRLATAMSNGDVSLSDDSKFKTFKRSDRRYLLGLLETITRKEEDMRRWRERWVRLGEKLHPAEFTKRFPTTAVAFSKLRNNERIETFNSKVEEAIKLGFTLKATTLLAERPGDFARRLDAVLCKTLVFHNTPENLFPRIVSEFLRVAGDVSTPVLLQVLTHFEYRNDARIIFPKGNVAQVMLLEKQLPELPQRVIKDIIKGVRDVLIARFSTLPALGKVYIDPALRDCLVPFSQRSASKTLRTLVRGSKLPFGNDKDTLRFFIWWKDKSSIGDAWDDRVDLDLSAVAYDSDWGNLGLVSYYNLREGYAVHSGDITSAPNGASEFVDINIPKAIAAGLRYVVMTVHGYTQQNFSELPECFAGFMLREQPQSGEVFDPRTIVDRMDLTMAAQSGVPLIIDLVDRKVIWADAAINRDKWSDNYGHYGYHNAQNTKGTIELLGKAFTSLHKPNLYDLFSLHTQGRGIIVDDESAADTVFSIKTGTPFEIDRIASEFMTDAVDSKTKAATA